MVQYKWCVLYSQIWCPTCLWAHWNSNASLTQHNVTYFYLVSVVSDTQDAVLVTFAGYTVETVWQNVMVCILTFNIWLIFIVHWSTKKGFCENHREYFPNVLYQQQVFKVGHKDPFKCNKFNWHMYMLAHSRQVTNTQYSLIIRNVENSADGIVITIQVQTSSALLSSTVITQALKVSILHTYSNLTLI